MILYKIPEFIIWVINTKKNKKRCLLLLFYYYYYTIILITSILAVSENNFIENNKNSIIINNHDGNSVKTIINDLVLTTNSNSNNNIKMHNNVGSVLVVNGNRNLLINNKSDHDNNIINNYNNNSLNNIKTSSDIIAGAQEKILTVSSSSSSSSSSMSHKITSDINNIDEEDEYFGEDDYGENNKSAKGGYIGASCEFTCNAKLHHVFCDPNSNTCDCEKNYPVVLGKNKGCAKPKKLGEQCYYHETCYYTDANSICAQVRHNAHCQCASGYHSVSHHKPVKRIFCTPDIEILTSDLPTLLGVTTGIAVLAGLICMVLHLFSKTKYPRHRNFGDANLAPPIMYSTDTVHSARPSSRSSLRSSASIGSFNGGGGSGINISGGGGSGPRRPSSAPIHSGSSLTGSKGVLVSTSRTGSRRPSLASVHSTSSSVRSYSTARFEKELQQKEIRQEMKIRLAKLQHNQHTYNNRPQITIIDTIGGYTQRPAPTPSPLTPNSTDELLPAVDEAQEVGYQFSPEMIKRGRASYHGPCSSTDAL